MAKRASLSSFAPKTVAPQEADGGFVQSVLPAAVSANPSAKYPKVSVYLEADEIRTLKLIGIDTGQRVNDICAAAIREWLEKNGHARGKHYKA